MGGRSAGDELFEVLLSAYNRLCEIAPLADGGSGREVYAAMACEYNILQRFREKKAEPSDPFICHADALARARALLARVLKTRARYLGRPRTTGSSKLRMGRRPDALTGELVATP
jgi:hypothetical protein